MVLVAIRDIINHHMNDLQKPHKTEILDTLLRMGLQDGATSAAKELGIACPATPVQKIIDVGMSMTTLQMEHMGHLLARPISDLKDDRVGFRPDLWQHKLLDVIDNNESALVCAPTSSGKTFISYYCMKKVLRTSDDGLVIFCAPNKQLAHQVKADVYAHFRSKTFKNPPWTLYGEYTNVWENVETCQILITAPEYLQTLLTNTKLYASISKRLQYLIVDEVHCIDELENGALWERMLMMTRCPFLALSATIGNIDEFHGWLQRCQDVVRKHDEEEHKGKVKRDYKVHKVPDGEEVKEITRWSDLQKYLYIPKTPEEQSAWKECRPKIQKTAFGVDTFYPIHPCSCVTSQGLATTGFPGDLGFVPRESMVLYGTMAEACESNATVKKRMQELHPDNYFKSLTAIDQKKGRAFEKVLKQELRVWSQDPALQPFCDATLDKHRQQLEGALTRAKVNGACQYEQDSEEWLAEHLIHLMTSLAAEDKLPVLIFNFEETTCENLCEKVVDFLEAKENAYKATPEFKKKMNDLAKRQKEAEARMKKHEKVLNNKKDEDSTEQDDMLDLSDLGDLREKDVLPQFSFIRAHEGEGLDEEELADALKRVEKHFPQDHVLYRCLTRGLGVHHFGLPYGYRQAVEVLFRAKHVKAVISTETMALGIHMPCRSVVFAGDHLQLNPLQFRQMSGRAGRRGFDPLGHVIFFGVPESKINRLMTSEIQSLKGHWPLTPALVHRLVNLYIHPGCKDKVQRRIKNQMSSLWLAPLIQVTMPGEDARANSEAVLQRTTAQVRQYFGTVIDTLMTNGLLAADGETESFSDMAGKLYLWDPSHFTFLVMLKEGVFHRITEKYRPVTTHEKFTEARDWVEARTQTNEQCVESLLLLMCHILGRREIHRSVLYDKEIDSESVHQVYLPNLTKEMQGAIQGFHKRTMDCFTAHVINAAREVEKEGLTEALPLSRIVFNKAEPEECSGILAEMAENTVDYEARSPFSALTGRGDVYETQDEMTLAVRDGIYVDSEMIPSVEFKDTSMANDGQLLLNAAVFDYQHSSSQDDVLKWNGLNYKESWEDLDRFMRFIVRVDRIFTIFEQPPKVPGQPTPDEDKEVEAKTPLLKCWKDLLARCQEAYSHADSKALSKQEKKKSMKYTTAKKPKRPPLIKRDPRAVRRR
uniref:RNA helicase n=2 Tax=Eutreptiella gymnastica TaxID=73025 RepID=A0A7S1NKP4_9EUGL